jgi:hypothetical protein
VPAAAAFAITSSSRSLKASNTRFCMVDLERQHAVQELRHLRQVGSIRPSSSRSFSPI